MPIDHIVRDGDCFDSVAKKHGFFPDTLWNHSENSDVKDERKDPNILMPGDVIHVPELTMREESAETEKKHRYRRKGVPARLRLVFTRPKPPEEESADEAKKENDPSNYEGKSRVQEVEHEPIANAPFVLTIDGVRSEGTSDGDGLIDVPLPPEAVGGTIRFYAGTEEELSYDLALGEMSPADTVIGVRKRLHNLGYRAIPQGEESDAHLVEALKRFQAENDLEPDGEINGATSDKLKELHGS